MYIIIVGGGHVGTLLSRELISLGHEVLVIERSQEQCELIKDELGSVVMMGDGCEVSTLGRAGLERAEVFIAVTEGDEDNLVACQIARHRFHVSHIIARVNEPRNEPIFKLLGITSVVNAVDALANRVLLEVPVHSLTHLVPFQRYGLSLVGVRIPRMAHSVGKKLAEIRLPEGSVVSVVVNPDHAAHVPEPDAVLGPDDEVLVLTKPEHEAALIAALTD